MKKIINYLVCTADTSGNLSTLVREYMERADDWQPFGGVTVSLSESDEYRYVIFAQAMVRYEAQE